MTRVPAEWEEQAALLVAWPDEQTDWSTNLNAAQSLYVNLIGTVSYFQPIIVLIRDDEQKAKLFSKLTNNASARPYKANQITCVITEYNDTWTRDYGPITLLKDEDTQALLYDFTFNGWGNKFAAHLDNAVNRRIDEAIGWDQLLKQMSQLTTSAWVLEGGSIEFDGQGTLMTTRHCLEAPNRNQPATYDNIIADLTSSFNLQNTLTLSHGLLEGDDTDGHIDTLARFCPNNTIVYQGCDRENDAHFNELSNMADQIKRFPSPNNTPYHCVELPLPAPKYGDEEQRLPASYANFTVINKAVLVPTYEDEHDDMALAKIGECFPNREIIGIPCTTLIQQGGSLHCITMHLPAAR